MRAQFGRFTLDTSTRELLRDDEVVRVSTKAFDVLGHLIEARPRVVEKSEILDRAWPSTHVGEGTLAAVVAELRSALGDDARDPQFIRTVHRVGYAFCAQVREGTAASRIRWTYRLVWGAREIQLVNGSNVLGRDPASVTWIDDPSISRRHAVVQISGDRVTVEDLGSKNGTFVRGLRVLDAATVHDGDMIVLGRVQMVFRVFRDGLPTESMIGT